MPPETQPRVHLGASVIQPLIRLALTLAEIAKDRKSKESGAGSRQEQKS